MRIAAHRLIDGVSDDVQIGMAIDFGTTITTVTESRPRPGAEQYTVLPGLIDAHVHLSLSMERFVWWRNSLSDAYYAYEAYRNADAHLSNGVTTVRDVGGIRDVAIQLKEAVRRGVVQGPTIASSGQWLAVTGGHGSIYAEEAGGAEGFRSAARNQLHHGADLIKIMATAGALAEEGKDPYWMQMTEAELRAVAEVTRGAGVPLAVHAHSDQAIIAAVEAGATSIEHGTWLSDEAIDLMIERGVWLVPTLAVMNRVASDGNAEQAAIIARLNETKMPQLRKAIDAGVRIAVGTDAGAPATAHGLAPFEVQLLHDAGMTPMQALKAGTSAAGDLVTGGSRGRLVPGAAADIVVVRGNPVDDLSALDDIVCVIRDGAVVKGQIPAALMDEAPDGPGALDGEE